MAAYGKELNTAEIAYAAIDEVCVVVIYYVNSLPAYEEQFTFSTMLFIYYFVYGNDYLILTEFRLFSASSFSCISNSNVLAWWKKKIRIAKSGIVFPN